MNVRNPLPPYPNSWYLIAASEELGPKGVLPLHYFGEELVLFRGEDGAPHLVEAHCPHLGAHLGHGGTVQGNDIQCPFHAWRYNGEGRCTRIPYSEKIPKQAKLRAWPVHESGGVIMAYHHATGQEPSVAPLVPVDDGVWSKGQWLKWKVRMHVQDVLENSTDLGHFQPIHGAFEIPKCTEAKLEKNLLHMVVHQKQELEGMTEPGEPMTFIMDVGARDLGSSLSTTEVGAFASRIFACQTPIDGEYVDLRALVQAKRAVEDDMTMAIEEMLVTQVRDNLGRDVNIWHNKIYRPRPVLCDNDGPIGPFRLWAKQFYEGSVGGVQVASDEKVA